MKLLKYYPMDLLLFTSSIIFILYTLSAKTFWITWGLLVFIIISEVFVVGIFQRRIKELEDFLGEKLLEDLGK